jgi:hypothetical protein
MDKNREAFEQWARLNINVVQNNRILQVNVMGQYISPPTQLLWEAWQAATSSANKGIDINKTLKDTANNNPALYMSYVTPRMLINYT